MSCEMVVIESLMFLYRLVDKNNYVKGKRFNSGR